MFSSFCEQSHYLNPFNVFHLKHVAVADSKLVHQDKHLIPQLANRIREVAYQIGYSGEPKGASSGDPSSSTASPFIFS